MDKYDRRHIINGNDYDRLTPGKARIYAYSETTEQMDGFTLYFAALTWLGRMLAC